MTRWARRPTAAHRHARLASSSPGPACPGPASSSSARPRRRLGPAPGPLGCTRSGGYSRAAARPGHARIAHRVQRCKNAAPCHRGTARRRAGRRAVLFGVEVRAAALCSKRNSWHNAEDKHSLLCRRPPSSARSARGPPGGPATSESSCYALLYTERRAAAPRAMIRAALFLALVYSCRLGLRL